MCSIILHYGKLTGIPSTYLQQQNSELLWFLFMCFFTFHDYFLNLNVLHIVFLIYFYEN